jgi:hypothetical protein
MSAPRSGGRPGAQQYRGASRRGRQPDQGRRGDAQWLRREHAVHGQQPAPGQRPANQLVPNKTFATIGDGLSDRGISWAWYSGGWNDARAGHPDPLFQLHHQAFAFFANLADGTAAKAEHLRDETEFFAAAAAGKLRAASFVRPLGPDNEHPGYADMLMGEQHVLDLINAVRNGPDCPTSIGAGISQQ